MADEESKKVSGPCAYCQRLAANHCPGCLKAPLYDEGFIEPTFYCNLECRKAGWSQHRSKCYRLQSRTFLGRAAMLLTAIICRIRLHASTLRFKSLRFEDSTVFLDGFQSAAEPHYRESEQALKPFPVPLNCDPRMVGALLAYMGSMDAMIYLHSFIKELMAWFASKIEESTVSVNDRKLQICPVSPEGQRTDLSDSLVHYVYKVTLKNGEVWVVDTTGVQYGYPGPLCPWPGFEQSRSCKVVKDSELGAIRQRAFERKAMMPVRHVVAQMTEKRELAEAIEELIPPLAQACGGKLSAILMGSDAISQRAAGIILDQLEIHLRISMTKLYTPDQIARRNQSIDLHFSQIIAYSDAQKAWGGLMRSMPTDWYSER